MLDSQVLLVPPVAFDFVAAISLSLAGFGIAWNFVGRHLRRRLISQRSRVRVSSTAM